MALWILPKRGLLCVGAKANVPLCGGKKLNKKMCGGEKKKYRRVGKVCRLSSCPFVIWSVCLCLSVKMVYASLVCLTVTVRVSRSVFTLAANLYIPATLWRQSRQIGWIEAINWLLYDANIIFTNHQKDFLFAACFCYFYVLIVLCLMQINIAF